MGFAVPEFLQSNIAQLVVWSSLGAVLLAVAVYLVKRFRDRTVEDRPEHLDLLTNFREIHHQGGLSDEEYRTIKAQLASRLQQELKDTKETG
ncbi:MAG: hypothetical protein SGJ20_13450 [Planctomycetota bacterium]|nr:hypothetical protein [Planctomycetota bacterium]